MFASFLETAREEHAPIPFRQGTCAPGCDGGQVRYLNGDIGYGPFQFVSARRGRAGMLCCNVKLVTIELGVRQ